MHWQLVCGADLTVQTGICYDTSHPLGSLAIESYRMLMGHSFVLVCSGPCKPQKDILGCFCIVSILLLLCHIEVAKKLIRIISAFSPFFLYFECMGNCQMHLTVMSHAGWLF